MSMVVVFVHDDRRNFGRSHRVDCELRRIVVPRHDVDTLASELTRHRLYTRSAHADTRAHRIDAAVVRLDRDLRSRSRVSGGAANLDDVFGDLRHFDLEQLDQHFR
jgi:hypothetical protein